MLWVRQAWYHDAGQEEKSTSQSFLFTFSHHLESYGKQRLMEWFPPLGISEAGSMDSFSLEVKGWIGGQPSLSCRASTPFGSQKANREREERTRLWLSGLTLRQPEQSTISILLRLVSLWIAKINRTTGQTTEWERTDWRESLLSNLTLSPTMQNWHSWQRNGSHWPLDWNHSSHFYLVNTKHFYLQRCHLDVSSQHFGKRGVHRDLLELSIRLRRRKGWSLLDSRINSKVKI